MSDIGTILGAGALVVVIDLAIRLVALVIIPRDRLPTAAMAWLLAVFFIPVIGVGLFLLIGNPKLPEKRRLKQVEMDAVIAEESKDLTPPSPKEEWPTWLEPIVTLTENLTAMPLVGGNSAHLIADYSGSLAAMAAEIDAASSYVHVEFYIFSLDSTTAPFFDSLEAAVLRGVTVRVLLDHWASSHCAGYKATLERLTAIGVEWQLMLPVQPLKGKYQRLDLRNHRKLLVVDGRRGLRGVAEPDRPQLQQEEEPQARPEVAGADVPARGPGGRDDRHGLRHGLVHRVGRRPLTRRRWDLRTNLSARRRAAPSTARSCRAGQASRWRTTSSCS